MDMKFCKRILPLLAVLLLLVASGCESVRSIKNIKNIKVTSWALKSVMPSGLRSVNAELSVGLDNPAGEFTVSDIEGILYYRGRKLADYTVEPVTVQGKTAAEYPVCGTARLGGDFNLLDVLSLVSNFDADDFTTDIHANARLKSGGSKEFNLTGLQVKDFIEKK